eukprot:m.182076 g.182076  ORF g.182076 m.182076 type:complete len:467 (+) comp39285_c0_seq13:668-2068(+)
MAMATFAHDALALKAKKIHQKEVTLGMPTSRVLDTLMIVDPSKKKLSSVEGRRVIGVLEEGIRRIEIVTLLPTVTRSLDRFVVLLGSELTRLLEDHAYLEEEYRRLTSSLQRTLSQGAVLRKGQSSGGLPIVSSRNSSLHQDASAAMALILDDKTKEKLAMLADELRQSVRNVVRGFNRNPAAANAVRLELLKDRSTESGMLLDLLAELKSSLKERLATSKQEENDRGEYLNHVSKREEKAQAEIQKLEEELDEAISKRQKEISEKEAIARKLENDLYTVQKTSQENDHRVLAEAEKIETGDLKAHETKRTKLEQELARLKKTLADNRLAHRESELNLRKRKFKVENELENWIREYDNDMSERQDELEGVQLVYDEEKVQLNELEERFSTLEIEYDRVVEEKRIAKQKAEEAQREMEKMIRAATMLQSLWRSFKCRKMLKQKQKGKKKGKKSGKKGGKKGGKKKKR